MMSAEEPHVSDCGRYSVKETCEVLGIHRNTLERYRKANVIKCGYRRVSNRKFYLGSEIKRAWRSTF